MKLIFLDTETTGIDPLNDRICQICYKVDGVSHAEYFKPTVPMSVKAMSVTHITNKMLAEKPAFAESNLKQELQNLLNAEGVLVAHNAAFDASMLITEGMSVGQTICTLRVARFLDAEATIPEYNLQYLRYYYDLEITAAAHDAVGDVDVLEAVFSKLLEQIAAKEGSEEAAIKKMIEVSSHPSLIRKFMFGKYYGQKVEDVLMSDRGYLEWLLGQKLNDERRDEEWIYTLEHYLNGK